MIESDPKDSPPADDPAKAGGPDPDPASDATPGPSAEIHAYISVRLREVYDDVARQPVPDRFLDLMRQLDTK